MAKYTGKESERPVIIFIIALVPLHAEGVISVGKISVGHSAVSRGHPAARAEPAPVLGQQEAWEGSLHPLMAQAQQAEGCLQFSSS